MAEVDPDWPDKTRSVGEGNDQLRQLLTEALEALYPERPDLLEKALPQYPPAAKRIIVDDGTWAATLHRDNVTLTTTGIDKIVPEGVVTVDGELHEFDVLLYGTGFQPSKFLTPMKVVGKGGVDLHGRWDGDARAYLGVTVPGFPNFFMLYGPNTNIVVNGVDHLVHGVRGALRDGRHQEHPRGRPPRARRQGGRPRRATTREIDAENLRMAWGVSTVNSWYKSESGRVAQNWPFPCSSSGSAPARSTRTTTRSCRRPAARLLARWFAANVLVRPVPGARSARGVVEEL